MSEYNHLNEAVQRLQQRVVALKRRVIGLDVILGGAAVALLATLAMTFAGWPVSRLTVYGAILLGAVLIFAVLAWRVRVAALPVLIRADGVLRLQERLSTAYEYVQQHAANPFVPNLAADADRIAQQVDPRVVFPTVLPRRVWGIPLLLAVIAGFSLLHLSPLHFDDMANVEIDQEVTREGKRLERWGRRLEQLAEQERLDRSLILARHMKNLGRRLQREGGEKPEIAQRISTLSQYLQRMQQELHERTLMSRTSAISAHDVLMSGKSVKQELRDILKFLQDEALPREMATVAEQSIQRLSRQLGPNPELEQLLQSLRAGNVKAARELLKNILQQQQTAEELENLDRARRALEYSSRTIQRGEKRGDAPVTGSTTTSGDASGSRMPFDFDDEMESEDMPGMEDFATPGLDKGFGVVRHSRPGQKRRLLESDQPLSKVQVESGAGDMRLSYVRYLPMQNEAREPIENVVVRYQHAAEEVLVQEKVPRDYREQIKQYFLAIGMGPEQKP